MTEERESSFMKAVFHGVVADDLIFPYPEMSKDERENVAMMIDSIRKFVSAKVDSAKIDRTHTIPDDVIQGMRELGLFGLSIPEEYGGLGLSGSGYARVMQEVAALDSSLAVTIGAHQSIGCKAIMLFGNEKQKQEWLPRLSSDWISAFCLSEPNVGCDAGGQETHCELSEDGEFYILNGEKKWATSGALSSLFTVMAKQKIADPKSGKVRERVTALVCHPEMEGVEIFQKNRSKCGIRGTWQA
ncbi:MAG: acyl-CoA dehydrogenase family protein, partial [Myxococcales bacterium]|nr:acyl-CoA dehydrogenase family protein [Myxococcales bacterium]